MDVRKNLIVENLIKNAVLVVLLALLFQPIRGVIFAINPANADTVLLFTSLTLVAVLFGNFAFTYEFSDVKRRYERLLAHFTTFLLMLLAGLLLEISSFAVSLKIDSLFSLSILVSVLIYVSVLLYDFWAMLRARI